MNSEFLHPITTNLTASGESQFHKGRTGQQGGACNGVISKPGVALQGELTSEQQSIPASLFEGSTQKRVIGRLQAQAGRIARTGGKIKPVALALEGISRQVDTLCAREDVMPIESGFLDVDRSKSSQ
jgi:hypothetical protein